MADEIKIVAKIVAQGKEAIKQAKKVGEKIASESQKAGKKIKFGEKVKEQLEKIKKGVEAIGIGGDRLSKIGDFFAAGKLAVAAAAVIGLGKAIHGIWDKMPLSAEEFAKKQALIIQDAQQATQLEVKQQKVDNSYLQDLIKLNELEVISNDHKLYAISLIETLTKRYGDLGLAINTATGEITGLDQAQMKMLFKQTKKNLQNTETEHEQVSFHADRQMTQALIQLQNQFVNGWLNNFMHSNFGLAPKSVVEAQDQIKGFSTEKQLEIFTKIRDQYANTEGEIEAVQKVIDLKKKQLELEEKIKMLREKGVFSEQEWMKQLKQRAEKNQIAKADKSGMAELSKMADLQFAMDGMKEKAQFSRLTTDEERITFWEKKKKKEEGIQTSLKAENDKLRTKKYGDETRRKLDADRLVEINEELAKLHPEQKATRKRLEKEKMQLETKTYETDLERAVDRENFAKRETKILESKKAQLQIEMEIEKLRKRSADFYSQQKDALDGQLQVQKLLLQGKYEEAEKQKLVNDLKKQGLKVDQQEVDLITKQKQALQGVQLDRSFKQQGLDLLDSLKPKNRQTAYEKRVRQLEEQSGMKLNQQQKDKVRTLVDVEFKMKQMEELKPDFSGLEIKTNEMTSRGGFAGGAVAPDTDRVNMQIRDYQARSYQTLAQIRAILQRGGII